MNVATLIKFLSNLPSDMPIRIGDTFYNGNTEVEDFGDPVLFTDTYTLYIVAKNGTQHKMSVHEIKQGTLITIP